MQLARIALLFVFFTYVRRVVQGKFRWANAGLISSGNLLVATVIVCV